MSNRVYNLNFQKSDPRDKIHITTVSKISALSLTLPTYYFIPIQSIIDQGAIGSCLANAIYNAFNIQSDGAVKLSRLSLYLTYRQEDSSSLCSDTGGTIRGSMRAIKDYSITSESNWPYITSNYAKLPPSIAFINTYNTKNFVYTFVPQDLIQLKEIIALQNLPIVFGITVYESFESNAIAKTGVIPMPNTNTEKILGGHAIILIGYDDKSQYFKFQNSWGSWGDNGCGYIPYNYVMNPDLASDFCYFTY
jgi:hypothetical protein